MIINIILNVEKFDKFYYSKNEKKLKYYISNFY